MAVFKAAPALEIADRGVQVELFERSSRVMQGASRHSERKIHLGYVYSGDTTLQTARLMAVGAAESLPAIRRWLGGTADDLVASTPFRYAAHRSRVRSPSELHSSYRAISRVVKDALRGTGMCEGVEPGHLRRLELDECGVYADTIECVYETGEIAIDTIEACRSLTSDPRIEMVVQPRRLGWPGNFNWLARNCDREYFCYWRFSRRSRRCTMSRSEGSFRPARSLTAPTRSQK